MSQEWQVRRQQILAATTLENIAFSILRETHEQAIAVASEHRWTEEEAYRLVFCYGLAYLRGESSLRQVERADTPGRVLDDFRETTRQMMEEATHAASLKFQAYRLAEDNHALEMRNNAMANELLMARNRLRMFRDDEDRLKARIRELEQENLRLLAQLPEPGQQRRPEVKRRGLLRVLGRYR